MTDPFWSISLGRWGGIPVRLHFLLLTFLFYQPIRAYYQQSLVVTACWTGLLLITLILHEAGHAWVAYQAGVDLEDVQLWPLGNMTRPSWTACLAQPSARFWVALAGPTVNLGLAVSCLFSLLVLDRGLVLSMLTGGTPTRLGETLEPLSWVWVIWTFGQLNIFFFAINLLPAFPMDGGHMLRAVIVHPRMGIGRDSMVEPWTARTCAVLLLIVGVVKLLGFHAIDGGMVLILLALLVEWIVRTESALADDDGFFEDGVFGYDFSEGYTSLENSIVNKVRPRQDKESALKRWRRRRVAAQHREDVAQVAADADRLDELLIKIHRDGRSSLNDEENQFLLFMSDKIRALRVGDFVLLADPADSSDIDDSDNPDDSDDPPDRRPRRRDPD